MSDLISRADAIDALSRSSVYAWSTEQDLVAHSWAIRILQSLPSADAVHGEWIRKEKEYNDCDGHRAYYWYECSVCGARPPKNQWKNEWHSDYCPSCGARMTPYKGGDTE